MQYVFVLDKNKQPLTPATGPVRQVLRKGGQSYSAAIPSRSCSRTGAGRVRHPCPPVQARTPAAGQTGVALVREGDNKVLWQANWPTGDW